MLQDKVWREEGLRQAYRLERSNGGAPGIEGVSVQSLERGEGAAQFLAGLRQEVQEKTDRPQPVRRVDISKADGKRRPWGMPPLRDRVAQRAGKLGMEPLFAADCGECAYGVRPKRDAQQAVGAMREHRSQLKLHVTDFPHESTRFV